MKFGVEVSHFKGFMENWNFEHPYLVGGNFQSKSCSFLPLNLYNLRRRWKSASLSCATRSLRQSVIAKSVALFVSLFVCLFVRVCLPLCSLICSRCRLWFIQRYASWLRRRRFTLVSEAPARAKPFTAGWHGESVKSSAVLLCCGNVSRYLSDFLNRHKRHAVGLVTNRNQVKQHIQHRLIDRF